MNEKCSLCGCQLHRLPGEYGKPSPLGRSHASTRHFVAERFFGRSKNRPTEIRLGIFDQCPWGLEHQHAVFCYDCHEELLHNPVLCPEDLALFADLVVRHGLNETDKPSDRKKIAGRIELLHEVVSAGLKTLAKP